ncbi:MAG: hypothetical protein FWC42_00475 [Proteobacteria bacterium]|nr:hypothetical protein [Pseudomonadota bacterium]
MKTSPLIKTALTILSAVILACALGGCWGPKAPPCGDWDDDSSLVAVCPSVSSGHGSISPSKEVWLNYGKTTTFTLTPDVGYTITSAGMGGTCGGALSGYKYTTNPIKKNCTVVATFSLSGKSVDYSDAVVTTIAGQRDHYGNVDGPGASATLNNPGGIALDSDGNLYIATETNIRRITPDGMVSTVAGTNDRGSCVHGGCDGPCTSATFAAPKDVAVDADGNVYVADYLDHTIRKISNPATPACTVSTLAGSGAFGSDDGVGAQASFEAPAGLAVDSSANVYIADGRLIRKVTPAGIVVTVAGTLVEGRADGPALSAQFSGAYGVVLDAQGNLYVSERGSNDIRKITPDGMVSTLPGVGVGAASGEPQKLGVDVASNLYIPDNHSCAIRKVTPGGEVAAIAGAPDRCGVSDGTVSQARLSRPGGVAVAPNGTIYFSDSALIRKIEKP